MCVVVNLVSEHVCTLIHEQYAYATGPADYNFYEAFPGLFFIRNISRDDDCLDELFAEYKMSKATWECSCLVMSTRLLPCRHVFYIRKRLNMETIIPTQLLNPRWLLETMEEPHLRVKSPLNSFAVSAVLPQPKTTWDPNRKFREANHFATSISESVSTLGMHEFRDAMQVLEKVPTLFKAKQFDKLSVLDGDDENNAELTSTGDPQRMEAVLLGTVEESSMQAGNQSEQSVGRSVATVGRSVEQSVESVGSMESVEQSVESMERLVETVATEHDKKLTLSTIMDLLTHQATYATCFDQLKQLKPFVLMRGNQNHLQLHRIDKLPIGKPILKPSEVLRILLKDLFERSSKKVTISKKSTPLWRNQMLLLNFRGLA
ncbi:hypothetical protein PHMEG_00038782 [Phytophthora megakarya]|uniref:SWIM-type domain-containing protein n=1 Tax=Phytophthora megakarya TaxID=4795 RepID=A0A225UH62_9STRA|nr:hypothetical protein PHMEG_00038782 [Phytophthora megakarya]